jgi:hypothetical protein
MVAWSVHDIKLEVINVAALLMARTIPDGGTASAIAAYDKLKSSVVATICNKIGSLRLLDSGSALELQVAVTEAALPEDSKAIIQEALDSQLASAAELVEQGVSADTKKQQLHIYPLTYLTQPQWDELWSDISLFRMSMLCAGLLRSLGLTSLHEQTVKWWVALLVVIWAEKIKRLPSHKLIHELVKDFKKSFASCPLDASHWPRVQKLYVYPEHIAELPAGFVAKSYGDTDLPVTKSLEKLAHVALHHVPLRSNSILLKEKEEPMRLSFPETSNGQQLTGDQIRTIVLNHELKQMRDNPDHQQNPQYLQLHAQAAATYKPVHYNHHKHQQLQPPQMALGDAQDSPPLGNDSPPLSSAGSSTGDSPMVFKPQLRAAAITAKIALKPEGSDAAHDAIAAGAAMAADPNRVSSEDYEQLAFAASLAGDFKRKKGKGKGKGTGNAAKVQKATAKPQPKAKPVAAAAPVAPKPMAKVAAKPKPMAKVAAKPVGCPRCRHTPKGCSQCTNPNYSGTQTKKEWLKKQAAKEKGKKGKK